MPAVSPMSAAPTFDTEKKPRNGGILRLRLAYGRRSNYIGICIVQAVVVATIMTRKYILIPVRLHEILMIFKVVL